MQSARSSPSAMYEPENTASHLIYRIGRLMRFRAAEHFKSRGISLSPEQWDVLIRAAFKGPGPISCLVDATLHDHPNITRMVGGLEKAGLVRRFPNPDDKRSHMVEVTAKGRQFADATLPDLVEAKSKFYAGLNEREIANLIAMLQAVESNLDHPINTCSGKQETS